MASPSDVASRGVHGLGRNAAIVGGATALTKVLGIIEKVALAFFFGTGPTADAYFVVTGFVLAVGTMSRELTDPVVMPIFVRRLQSPGGEQAAWALVRWFLVVVAALLLSAAVGLLAWPTVVVDALAPGLSSRATEDAVRMLRFGAVAIGFFGVSSIAQTALHGLGRFGAPALADLAYRVALILGCGAAGMGRLGMSALGLAMVTGAVARLGVQLFALPSESVASIGLASASREDLTASVRLVWPLILGVFYHYAGEWTEMRYTSLAGAGAIAARLYAKKVVDVPVLLLPYVLSVVAFPYLTTLCARGDWGTVSRLVGSAARWTGLLFVPAAIIAACFAKALVALLLEHGRFDRAGADATAAVLSVYAAGLPIFALEALLVPVFFATGNTVTPIWCGVVAVTLDIVGIALLGPTHGIVGIAASLVAAKAAKLVMLTRCSRRYLAFRAVDLVRQGVVFLAAFVPATLMALSLRQRAPTGHGVLLLLGYLSVVSILVAAVFALGYAGARAWICRLPEAAIDTSSSAR